MTLTAMRRALREEPADAGAERPADGGEHHPTRPKSRLPPAHRGVKQSRSCLVEMNLASGGDSQRKRGTLTFANTVGTLKRAGSSREGADGGLRKPPPRRSAPTRARSSMARVARGSADANAGPTPTPGIADAAAAEATNETPEST